jgi:hypothetical protein
MERNFHIGGKGSMKFSILIAALALIIQLSLKTKKYLRDMISVKNHTFVMMTRDGKRGRRFIFRNGQFSSDSNFSEYDLAFVWKDGNTAFKVLTTPDPVGLHKAIANWDLELKGDESLSLWFTIFLGYATGSLKRK